MPWFRGSKEKAASPTPSSPTLAPPREDPEAPPLTSSATGPAPLGNSFRVVASFGTPATGTLVRGEVLSGSLRQGMRVRLQSAPDGTLYPAPIEVVKIIRHKSMRVVLYRGQNSEVLKEVSPASGHVGIKVKGVQPTEVHSGDLLVW
jgi:hypothetical protein